MKSRRLTSMVLTCRQSITVIPVDRYPSQGRRPRENVGESSYEHRHGEE